MTDLRDLVIEHSNALRALVARIEEQGTPSYTFVATFGNHPMRFGPAVVALEEVGDGLRIAIVEKQAVLKVLQRAGKRWARVAYGELARRADPGHFRGLASVGEATRTFMMRKLHV